VGRSVWTTSRCREPRSDRYFSYFVPSTCRTNHVSACHADRHGILSETEILRRIVVYAFCHFAAFIDGRRERGMLRDTRRDSKQMKIVWTRIEIDSRSAQARSSNQVQSRVSRRERGRRAPYQEIVFGLAD